jgi:hypothetical protein
MGRSAVFGLFLGGGGLGAHGAARSLGEGLRHAGHGTLNGLDPCAAVVDDDGPQRLDPAARARASIAFRSSSVLASARGLSWRQRAMRGKRSATPDLWRGISWMPSKAISKTCSGLTARTGPKRSVRVLAHPAGDLGELGIGQAGIGLGEGHQIAVRRPRRRR